MFFHHWAPPRRNSLHFTQERTLLLFNQRKLVKFEKYISKEVLGSYQRREIKKIIFLLKILQRESLLAFWKIESTKHSFLDNFYFSSFYIKQNYKRIYNEESWWHSSSCARAKLSTEKISFQSTYKKMHLFPCSFSRPLDQLQSDNCYSFPNRSKK